MRVCACVRACANACSACMLARVRSVNLLIVFERVCGASSMFAQAAGGRRRRARQLHLPAATRHHPVLQTISYHACKALVEPRRDCVLGPRAWATCSQHNTHPRATRGPLPPALVPVCVPYCSLRIIAPTAGLGTSLLRAEQPPFNVFRLQGDLSPFPPSTSSSRRRKGVSMVRGRGCTHTALPPSSVHPYCPLCILSTVHIHCRTNSRTNNSNKRMGVGHRAVGAAQRCVWHMHHA